MKVININVTFVVREEFDLADMTQSQLMAAIRDCLEDEHRGVAAYNSAQVTPVSTNGDWAANPERMGGCWTFEEIAESRGWR